MGKQKAVSYPSMLDQFGKELAGVIQKLEGETFKPALISDAKKIYEAVFWIQQLMTMFYNLQVQNYVIQMDKIVAQEVKISELETKLAGYSERLVMVEGKLKMLDGVDPVILGKALQREKELQKKEMGSQS